MSAMRGPSMAMRQAAIADPIGVMAVMFLDAFGVALTEIQNACVKMMVDKDVVLISMCVAAAVQIRSNTVFISQQVAEVVAKYPIFVINGDRGNLDSFNFGALHAAGHVFCHMTINPFGKKALMKAGSCITGDYASESAAGKINKEIAGNWPAPEVDAFRALVVPPETRAVLDNYFASLTGRATKIRAPPVVGAKAAAKE